ncbi:MAG: endonuclease/exonuclease/phosphatase family protein [Phycisphaerales bacterium]
MRASVAIVFTGLLVAGCAAAASVALDVPSAGLATELVASEPVVAEPRPPIRYGVAEAPPRTDGAIRIASYNVLNLFDAVNDPDLEGEFDDLPMATDPVRAANIAAMIRRMDADVIALQEVESEACLIWFRDTYLSDLGYEHVVSRDVGYYRGVECSILSRFPIEDVQVWPQASLRDVVADGPGFAARPADADAGLEYQRSPLRATIRVRPDYALTVYCLHHKSGRTYSWKREAEALRTVEKIAAEMAAAPDRNIVVMGDFNAAPWDKSLRLYLEAGLVDTQAHRVIPRSRDADQTEANLAKTHESGRVIDYILCNGAAYREIVPGTAVVLGKPYDTEYDWRNDPYPSWYASDHHPLMVELMPVDRR